MTPDSPKGPEREARPPLRVRIAQAMAAHPSLGGLYSDHPDSYLKPRQGATADYVSEADAVLAVVEAEIDRVARARDEKLERLTTEVTQLRADMRIRQDALIDVLGRNRSQVTPSDYYNAVEDVAELRRENGRLTAEVERLRQRVHAAVDETQRRYAPYQSRCDKFDGWSKWARDEYERHGDRWGMQSEATRLIIQSLLEEHDELRQAAEAEAELLDQEQAERKAEVSRLREQLAAQPALPEDWESQVRRKVHTWVGHIAKAQTKNPNTIAERNGWVYNAESCADDIAGDIAVLIAGWGVSSSEVEAPQQHKVLIYPGDPSLWTAYCQAPRCGQWSGGGTQQHAEDWKDGHEADTLVPQLQANSKLEQNLDDAVLFAVAQDRVRRDKGERHTLADVAEELELLDEGRPSGSERLAPRHVDELLARLRGLVFDLQDKAAPSPVEYDNGWRDGQIQTGNDLEALLDEYAPDAAQAAWSGATPSNPAAVVAGVWGAADHLTPPSPSLRKEGEDTPSPSVSTQEEKEGETGE